MLPFSQTPVSTRTFVFVFVDFETEAAEIDIPDGATEAVIRGYFGKAFPALKAANYFVKGICEGSKTGVFKPLHRVNWKSIPEKSKLYLDIATGSDAERYLQESKSREEEAARIEAARVQNLRLRWGEGYRKCNRCKQMFLIQNNREDSCKFIDEGFSPSSGRYHSNVVARHVQAKPKNEKYNDYVRDIRVVGAGRSVGLGVEGIGLVEHARDGGSLGSHGENVNGWELADFENLPGVAPMKVPEPVNDQSNCVIC